MRHQVENDWNGWDGDTVVQLADGSVWRQDEYHYEYHYAYRPNVTLFGSLMHIEGTSSAIRVRRIDQETSHAITRAGRLERRYDRRTDQRHGLAQDQHYYRYQYKYRPRVIIDGRYMHVEGLPKTVRVRIS